MPNKGNRRFKKGDIVLISGIQTKPEWNGTFCTIEKYVKNKKRYHITFYDQELMKKEASLKSCNLSIIYDSRHPSNSAPTVCRGCSVSYLQNDGLASQDDKMMRYIKNVRNVSQMIECPHCKSIFFCSWECMKQCLKIRHSKDACPLYKRLALMEHQTIKEFRDLFEFNVVAPFWESCEWLHSMNLHSKGIWKEYCGCNDIPFGDAKLKQDHSFWGFKKGKYYKSWFPDFSKSIDRGIIIENWEQYYKVKQTSLKSPIAHYMGHIMTVYHALVKYVKIHSKADKEIIIHLIGVQIELDILWLFKELLCLLPRYNFIFYCFGNALHQNKEDVTIGKSVHGSEHKFALEDNSITFILVEMDYNDINMMIYAEKQEHRIPHLAIGLNSGFEAYPKPWYGALLYIQKKNIPAFFTEMMNFSIYAAEYHM